MAYKKGQSGNPKGRPKQTAEEKKQKEAFKKLLKSATVEALETIIRISQNPRHREQFKASAYIIDKAYGNKAFFIDDIEGEETISIKVIPYHKEKENHEEETEDWLK